MIFLQVIQKQQSLANQHITLAVIGDREKWQSIVKIIRHETKRGFTCIDNVYNLTIFIYDSLNV